MRPTSVILAAVLLVAAPAASAAPKPITGKLSKAGFAVIAVAYDGTAVTAKGRSFRVVPSAGKVTLQLRTARGKYAGPVVVSGRKGTVVLGVRAGAKLGTITVRNGYAVVARKVASRWVDAKRTAQARKGVPLGNGRNFGLVRSKRYGPSGGGLDRDLDGVPDSLDIDLDGDLVLNPVDGGTGARQAAPGPTPAASSSSPIQSSLHLSLQETVNENAVAVTPNDVDQALIKHLQIFGAVPEGDLVELDCGGLSYCSPGGTGVDSEPQPNGTPFPGCCDPDGNGFGNLRGDGAAPTFTGPLGTEFHLNPNAPASAIGSGDTMVARVTTGGTLTETPIALPFVFTSVPALVSYQDGAGNSQTLTYPATGAAGALPVARNGSGDFVMTGTFWRPQRAGVAGAGETGPMDIGGLAYSITVQAPAGQQFPPGTAMQCPVASLSTTDPSLTPQSEGNNGAIGDLVDGAPDRPAAPANTFTATVNLSTCLSAKGVTLKPNDVVQVGIEARSGGLGALSGFASQSFSVTTRP